MNIPLQVSAAIMAIVASTDLIANGVPKCSDIGITPEFVHVEPARYPRKEKWVDSGFAVVEFTIQADGTLTELAVVASEPTGFFDRAATWAVAHSRAKPVHTACRFQRRLDYKIDDTN